MKTPFQIMWTMFVTGKNRQRSFNRITIPGRLTDDLKTALNTKLTKPILLDVFEGKAGRIVLDLPDGLKDMR